MRKYQALMFAVLVVLAGYSSLSTASGAEDGNPPSHPNFTDAQKKCFTDNGLPAPPERPSERPARETVQKVHACLKENGFKGQFPPHHRHGGNNQGGPGGGEGAAEQAPND